MALDIGVQEGKSPKEGGIRLSQMSLISAIANEITRQCPGIAVVPRQFNSIIAAANDLVDEFAKPIVKATPAWVWKRGLIATTPEQAASIWRGA